MNWDSLPAEVKNVQLQAPEFSMMFLFASPDKLDVVKEKLSPVLGEDKLIIGTDTTAAKSLRKFLDAIGR